MKRIIFVTLAFSTTASGLLAQEHVMITGGPRGAGEGVVIAQGAIGMIGLSGEPANVKFTQEFSFINGRTVTNAPYSADEKTESLQTLSDRTRITNTTTARVYRDSQGRTRREMTLPGLGGDSPHTLITISDPVAGVNYTFDPAHKVAHQMPGIETKARMKLEMDAKVKAEAEERTSEGRMSEERMSEERMSEARTSEGRSSAMFVRRAPPPTMKHEDLGANVIESVSATGTRDTTVIEAGAVGNDRPITITSERWWSPDLQIEIKSIYNDPRMGQTTHTVTNINRSEPDGSLFQVPADYKIEDLKAGPQLQHYEYHSDK